MSVEEGVLRKGLESGREFLAVLGRQPQISIAELERLFDDVRIISQGLAIFRLSPNSPCINSADYGLIPNIHRLGGTLKIAQPISGSTIDFLRSLPPEGKITLGISDFSRGANPFYAEKEALRLKKILTRAGRSVRVVPNRKSSVLSTATTLHNHLYKSCGVELIKFNRDFYRVIAVQNIDAYTERDQARPARDAKVGMLPPKLAQILINLCGNCPEDAVLLDPFCGTGVILQEGGLMKYNLQGSDLDERMIQYTRKNLLWLAQKTQKLEKNHQKNVGKDAKNQALTTKTSPHASIVAQMDEKVNSGIPVETNFLNLASVQDDMTLEKWVTVGDARDFQWQKPVDLVACETYLGPPMSQPPAEIKLKEAKIECKGIILGFLRNLANQIRPGTPVTIAVPAWLRPEGHYERLNILDDIKNLGYNVESFKNLEQFDLLYHRERQVVAREIIVLRKD